MVTAGAWYLFLLSLDRFLFPVMSLSSFWTQVQTGLSAAERVFALIDAEPNVVQTRSPAGEAAGGQIDFEQVAFRYKEDEPVLKISACTSRPGENIALVGHTGAGKSSHRQADRALLRVPGRADPDRRAGYPHAWTWPTTAASWGSCRRCRSCSPVRCWRTSAMPARR